MQTYGRFTPAPNTNFRHSGYQVPSQASGPDAMLSARYLHFFFLFRMDANLRARPVCSTLWASICS